MAFGGSGYADTINSCPTHSASGHNLRDHAVRLLDRRERHRLTDDDAMAKTKATPIILII
jgi:hypothetical protein